MGVARADGYAVFNYLVPLRRGLRLPDGITFEGGATPIGAMLARTEPVIHEPGDTLPPPAAPMDGSLRIRLLRVDRPHSEVQLWHDLYSQFVRLTGRPNEMPENARAPGGDVVCTVAQLQVASPCKLGSDNSLMQADRDAFGWGLFVLRELQYAYRQAADGFALPVSKQNLPPFMWMDARVYARDGSLVEDRGVGAFNSGGGLLEEFDTSSLTEEQVNEMLSAAWSPHGDSLFQRYNIFLLDSREAFYIAGDYRATILNAAIAAECLFDDLLNYALWWERKTPQEAVPILNKAIYGKVKTEFAPRFYGKWLPQKGPILNWHQKVARLRDRVIHGGYLPTEEEAHAALDATRGVRKYLTRVVTDRRVRKKYRHLPLLLLGPSQLKACGIDLEPLANWYTSPLSYGERLDNWRSVCRRLRLESLPGAEAIVPEMEKATVFTLLTNEKASHYAIDTTFALACEISLPHLLPEEKVLLRREQATFPEGEFRMMPFVEFGTSTRLKVSDWLPAEEYLSAYEIICPEPE